MHTIIKTIMAVITIAATTINAQCAKRLLTVEQLFDMIEQNNSQMNVLKSQLEAANEGIASAHAARLPDINASLSFSYHGNALITSRDFSEMHGTKTPHFGNSFSVECVEVLYSGGAITAGEELARLGREQTLVATQLTRLQLRFLAVSNYLDLFKLDNGIQVYDNNIKLTKQLISDVNDRYAQGMVLKNDITRYELQLEQLQLGKTDLQNKRLIINHALCNLLGIDTSVEIEPDQSLLATTRMLDDEMQWQRRAIDQSPSLKQDELKTQVAKQEEIIARSELRPKISLFAINNFTGPILTEVPPINKNINSWAVGVGMKYNLGALYKGKHKVNRAVINTRTSIANQLVAEQQLNNQVQSAYVKYQQSFVALTTQQKSVELANQNFQVVNDRYHNQLAIVTDMIDATSAKLNAELNEVDARINTIFALYRLKYVAGDI